VQRVALLLVVLQTLMLVAALSLFGQLIVGAFNWGRRHENFVYQLFEILTKPVVSVVRVITPRLIVDQHVPMVAFLLLFFGYFVVGFLHRDVCLKDVTQTGCARWAQARGAT
jgi:uncharacterized protein YggT (Ycf19 family)